VAEEQSLAFFQKLEKKVGIVKIDEDISLELTLDKVFPKDRQPEGWECFTLTFTSPAEHGMLKQSIHTLVFENDQEVPIFLVPIEADNTVVEYEAVFNRKLQPVS